MNVANHKALWEEQGIDYGYCLCGCGKPTSIATANIRSRNMIKGEPRLYTEGHGKHGPHSHRAVGSDVYRCRKCQQFLPASSFKLHTSGKRYASQCRPCYTESQRELDSQEVAPFLKKAQVSQIKIKYGLSVEDYQKLLDKQKSMCDICSREFSEELKPHVDHCHENGHVRGLLCHYCNTAIGLMNDSSDRLLNAVKYLERGKNELQ